MILVWDNIFTLGYSRMLWAFGTAPFLPCIPSCGCGSNQEAPQIQLFPLNWSLLDFFRGSKLSILRDTHAIIQYHKPHKYHLVALVTPWKESSPPSARRPSSSTSSAAPVAWWPRCGATEAVRNMLFMSEFMYLFMQDRNGVDSPWMQRPRSHAGIAAAVANKARSSPALDAKQEVELREEYPLLFSFWIPVSQNFIHICHRSFWLKNLHEFAISDFMSLILAFWHSSNISKWLTADQELWSHTSCAMKLWVWPGRGSFVSVWVGVLVSRLRRLTSSTSSTSWLEAVIGEQRTTSLYWMEGRVCNWSRIYAVCHVSWGEAIAPLGSRCGSCPLFIMCYSLTRKTTVAASKRSTRRRWKLLWFGVRFRPAHPLAPACLAPSERREKYQTLLGL